MSTYRPKFSELVYASIALAFLAGSVLAFSQHPLGTFLLLGLAVGVTLLAYAVLKVPPRRPKKPVWVPESEAGTVPRYGSRRWARANYFSGIISMEELNAFYAAHPEDNSDPDR